MSDTDVDLYPNAASAATTTGAPQTPPRNDLNAAAPGELSPPRSQTDAAPATGATNGNVSAAATNGTTESFAVDASAAGSFLGQGKQDGNGPGEWRSKKSQDEMARAWEFVVDREFSLREFGDVVMLGRKARGLS